MKHRVLSMFLFAVSFATPITSIHAQESRTALSAFPDFLPIRAAVLSSVITANPERALAFPTTYRDDASGKVRISVERDGGRFFVLFLRERGGAYPYGSRGNVIIERDAKTGYVTHVLWYLSDDGMSWISLTPQNERTLVDFVVSGSLVRGGYPVSRLIYYFFTNSFRYLYDVTKAGLDWSLVFGTPAHEAGGPQEAVASLAAELSSGTTSGVAGELLRAARDFTTIGRYLALTGVAGSAPVEETATPYAKLLASSDSRSPELAKTPAWKADRGLAVEAAAGIMVGGIADGRVYLALVEGIRDTAPVRLAIVPYRDEVGSYVILAVDADSGLPVDFAGLVRNRHGAWLRLFRLPGPAPR